ncbi:MAG: FAD:protein FMN transferase [Phycisphaerales bacterium]
MGVQASITLYADDEATAKEAAAAAFERLDTLEAVMSDYRPDSELMRLSNAAGDGPVPVSEDLYRALEVARRFAQMSSGAFDPTVGAVSILWREARATETIPDRAAILNALPRVGFFRMRLNEDPGRDRRTVELDLPGMRLDLGGIGKGFAADEALEVLRARGVGRALVDLGGDLVAGDPPPGADGWSVTIRTHDPERDDSTITLTNRAIATSGDLEQFIEHEGVRYSHVIDPRTGYGLTTRVAVTVLAPDGATADALASAISVLGPKDGLALAQRFEGVATRIAIRGESSTQIRASADFPVH